MDDPNCAGDDHHRIQDAVDNADAGDTIVVCSGFYHEAVTIDKPLTIEVPDGSTPVLSAEVPTVDNDATAITVEPSAAGTTIEGLEVMEYGTALDVSASDTVVREVLANRSDTGVVVSATGTATVSNVTITNSWVDDVTTGIAVESADSASVSDVRIFRSVINGSDVGVRIDGGSSVPLTDVSVRQSLVSNSTTAGVSTTSGTNVTGIRVTRNFLRDNAVGIDSDGDGTLTAWLNHWSHASGPSSASGSVTDPVTGAQADGSGDPVSADVHFDPWLGKGACTSPQIRNVTDRTLDIRLENPYDGVSASISLDETVQLGEFQPTCLWERAGLPLRANDSDAATSVRNLQMFVRGESTADVPANRPQLSAYQQGEAFRLEFESAAAADTSRFAGSETQLLVVRGEEATTDYEVGFDNDTGEGRLRVDATAVAVVDTPALDSEGELSTTFTPTSAGDYTFVLVRNDFGSGVRVDGSDEFRVDGGITVVGAESVPVQNEAATGNTDDPSYPAGSNVTFQLESNLGDGSTNHSVFLYDESAFADQRVTIEVDGNVSEAISGDVSSSDVTIERSIRSVNGFVRADTGFSALGFEIEAQNRSGRIDAGPFLDVALSEFGVEGASDTVTSDAVVLNGSVVVDGSSDSATAVEVETFRNFSTGTYRWVYVAEQGSEASSDTGEVDITTPTPTAPPGGGGGGGGGGGLPGRGADGTVEIRALELLNQSVQIGEPVAVRVDLANFDPYRGQIRLNLTANGDVVTRRTVGVDASTRRTVFVRHRFGQPGTYDLALNGEELGTVTVTDRVTPTPSGTPEVTPTPTRTPTDAPTPTVGPTPTETPEVTPTVPASPTPGLPQGPGAPTGRELLTALVMVLGLLAAVGVAVYVLPAP